MKTKALLGILLPIVFGLSGCVGGEDSPVSQDTSSQDETIKPEKLHMTTIKKDGKQGLLSVNGEPSPDDLIIGFDNVKIGTGIDPVSGDVYNASVPLNEEAFYFYNGDGSPSSLENKKNYIRPLNVCNGFSLVSSASENGKVTSTSSNKIFAGGMDFGMNLGLAKIKAAASYSNEQLTDSGSLSISKDIGAWLTCRIYSYADPDYSKSETSATQFGEALLKSNQAVANAIGAIRAATDLTTKQNKIQEFYKEFGTHMVSSVDVGEVAATHSVLTQNVDTETSSQKASAAASFSYGFASGSANFSMADATKFDSKSWNMSINEKYFPSDTKLTAVIDKLKQDLIAMRADGIIDYSKLKPEAVKIDLPAAPDLSKITFDESGAVNYVNVITAYKSLEKYVPSFNEDVSFLGEIGATDDLVKGAQTTLSIIESSIAMVNTNVTSLSYSQYQTFVQKYSNVPSAATKSGLKSALTIPVDEQKIAAAVSNYNKFYSAYDTKSLALESSMNELKKKVADFRTKYPTLEIYFAKYASGLEGVSADKAEEWAKETMANTSNVTYLKYRDLYYSSLEVKQNVALTKKMVQNSLKAAALRDSGNPFGIIYDNHTVTNFNVVPWSRVFPELAKTFALDDTGEIILTGIDKTIDDVERQYSYLLFSMKADSTNNGELSNWFVSYKKIFNQIKDLKSSMLLAKTGASGSSVVSFNGIGYDINTIEGSDTLNNAVQDMINNSGLFKNTEFETWLASYNTLKQYRLLGNIGSLPMYSVHGGYNNTITNDQSWIPMTKQVEEIKYDGSSDVDKRNPLRTILHLISTNLFNNKSVIARSYNPGNIASTSYGSEDFYKSTEFQNDYNARYRLENALSNAIPANDKPYQMMGVIPVLTSSSKTTAGSSTTIISKVVLTDSAGNIWNPNFRSGGADNVDRFNDDTLYFNLVIDNNTGVAVVENAKFYEYHWKFGDSNDKSYNNMIMLSHDKNSDDCWHKGANHYTPTCVSSTWNDNVDMTTLQIEDHGLGDFARVVDKSGNTDILTPYANSKLYPLPSSGAGQGVLLALYDPTTFNIYIEAYKLTDLYFFDQFSIVGGGYGKYWENNNKGFITDLWYRGMFDQYRDTDEHIPHGLRLVPMTPDLITKVAGKIDGNTKKQPLLPSYHF